MSQDEPPSTNNHARRYWGYGLVAFGATSTVLPLAYIIYRRKLGANVLAIGRNSSLARPPPRRQPAAIALQTQAGAGSVDASMAPEEPSERRKGFASLVPEDVPIPTRDEVSNEGLSSLKALGFATLGVFAVFGVSLLALRSYLNINTVDEFAAEMRRTLAKNLPDIDLPPANSVLPAISPEPSTTALQDIDDWTWEAAQERLEKAFEADGFTGWLTAAAQEIEAERRLERKKWANSS